MSEAVAIRGDDPSFAGDEQLGGRQAEDLCRSSSTDGAAVQAGSESVGCIDDQRQAVLPGQRLKRRDIARVAEIMADRDGDRPGRDRRRDRLHRDIGCVGIDVDEDRAEVVPDDRGRPRQKREAGDDDLAERFAPGPAPRRAKPGQRLHGADCTA